MKSVCVQGAGFVGAAMAVAIASARDVSGNPIYQVTAVDQDSEAGKAKNICARAGSIPVSVCGQQDVRRIVDSA